MSEVVFSLKEARSLISELYQKLWSKIIWQWQLIDWLIIATLARWHVLLEGVPWLAKTLAAEYLAQSFGVRCSRIQFTPDLLPSDIIWTQIRHQWKWSFETMLWPVFSSFVLWDEINRAPAKVQSALLEAMSESSVSIWTERFDLPQPFMVVATQNPLEQQWTYPLPEAQLDRFLMKIPVDYPNEKDEIRIMRQYASTDVHEEYSEICTLEKLQNMQRLLESIHVSDEIYAYIKNIVFETRYPWKYLASEMTWYLRVWASPRASLAFVQCWKARALIEWRDYVLPEDIAYVAYPVLFHRLLPSYQAFVDKVSIKDIIEEIIRVVPRVEANV